MPQVIGALAVGLFSLGVGPGLSLFLAQATVRLLTSVAVSVLYSQLAEKSQTRNLPAGIRTAVTQAGGVNPTSFILGTYATAGSMVCPPMSHGAVSGTPNAYLTYVVALGDIQGMVMNRVIIDGEYVTLSASVDLNGFYSVLGRFSGYASVKFYSGSQSVADPWLLSTYGSYPTRPWTSDMIGRDQCYAIVMFRFSQDIYSGFPQVRFEMLGIPLYDPRFDTTVGGSGTQRWANKATWVTSGNPMVQQYNIMRGISFVDGSVWGGGIAEADLPLTEWFAAMNACDVSTALLGGGTEAAYRTGLEVRSDDEPAAIIEEILKGCSGQSVDMGGVWKVKVGAVGLPVLFITDDDVIVSKPQEYDPFPNLSDTYNGVSASHPEPVSLYESVSAPIRLSAADEVLDGGRRLVADLALAAVPYKDQAQRLMEAYRLDNRRFRRHGLTLGPSAMVLEPTDTVSWTSEANGYTSKVFEVNSVSDDLMTALQRVGIRERDAADYAWNATTNTKATAPAAGMKVIPAAQTVPSWNVTAITLSGDVAGVAIPALNLTWNGANQDDVDALKFQIRLASSGVTSIRGSTNDVDSGAVAVANGIVGNTAYEARGRFVVKGRATSWSAWVAATTAGAAYVPAPGTFSDADFTLQNAANATKQLKFDVSNLAVSSLVTLTAPTSSGVIVTKDGNQTLTGKSISAGQITGLAAVATAGTFASLTAPPTTLAGYGITDAVPNSGIKSISGLTTFTGNVNVSDANFKIQDDVDPTKQMAFQVTAVTPGTIRVMNVPDFGGTLVLDSGAQAIGGAKTFTSAVAIDSGSAATPALAFATNLDSGFFNAGGGTLGYSVAGVVAYTLAAGTFSLRAVSTEAAIAQIGFDRSGDGTSSLALITDNINTSGGTRVTRYGGVNGIAEIRHKGTGGFQTVLEGAATWILNQNNVETMRANSTNQLAIGVSNPNNAAKVQIDSVTQGFLPPRMTTAQRDAIATPPNGLFIFNTTTLRQEVCIDSVWGSASFSDALLTLQDDADATKQAKFQLSGITTATTRTLTIPDASGTLALLGSTQTFTATQVFSSHGSFGTSDVGGVTGLATGATTTGLTKTVNIGTGGLSGSTSNVVLGSSVAGALGQLFISPPTVIFAPSVTAITMAGADLFFKAPTHATITGAATLTNANIQTRTINYTGGVAAVTLPTGATLDALFTVNNTALEFSVINTGTGIATLTANTGVTIIGAAAIAVGASALYYLRRSAASTYIAYRRGG